MMDARFLRHYNRELQFVRELGTEFAREYPKIAGRLGLEGLECADPYVERLLESFAFLTARVQLKLEAQFPRFTQHLLEMVYPHYLCPTPSMTVVELKPNANDATQLEAGFPIPRGSALFGQLGGDQQTACEYRTAHAVTLWPLEIAKAGYNEFIDDLGALSFPGRRQPRSTIRLRLRSLGGIKLKQLALQRLPLFIHGEPDLVSRLHEQLSAHIVGAVARSATPGAWREVLRKAPVRAIGFDDDEALLPVCGRSFQGYRLLHEYFAFPSRFLFMELCELAPAVRRCAETELEIVLLLDNADSGLSALNASHLRPFCTPAVNLFPRSTDRIHLSDSETEYHVVPDRTRPLDFEVHSIRSVVGYGMEAQIKRTFQPFYAHNDLAPDPDPAYYTLHREPRLITPVVRERGTRTSYVGSEVFVSLVDGEEGPFRTDLKQLGIEALCTNRDLPLLMPVGMGRTDFSLASGAPVGSIRCLAGPTPPRPSHAHGDASWRLISHLSLNYLSLVDGAEGKGAAALREMLLLYADLGDASLRKQIEGLVAVSSRPVVRRRPPSLPLAFVRGLEITLTCDEAAFEGVGVLRLGSVLDRFFAKCTSINSVTETLLKTKQRGEIVRWPVRAGAKPAL